MEPKKILITLFLLLSLTTYSQSIEEFKNALTNPKIAVQAIHTYPRNIKNGECHNVEVTSIKVNNNRITIIESWTDGWGGDATTTLTGVIKGDSIEGTWESSFSSGFWSYDIKNNIGKWNKTETTFNLGTFTKMENLRFEIVNNSEIRDGFFKCN